MCWQFVLDIWNNTDIFQINFLIANQKKTTALRIALKLKSLYFSTAKQVWTEKN